MVVWLVCTILVDGLTDWLFEFLGLLDSFDVKRIFFFLNKYKCLFIRFSYHFWHMFDVRVILVTFVGDILILNSFKIFCCCYYCGTLYDEL